MITRRDFLKLAALSTGVFAFRPFRGLSLPTFPDGERLGRISVGKMDVFARADGSGQPIGAVYEDNLIVWVREVVGSMLYLGWSYSACPKSTQPSNNQLTDH
jgi:hypothetical protein